MGKNSPPKSPPKPVTPAAIRAALVAAFASLAVSIVGVVSSTMSNQQSRQANLEIEMLKQSNTLFQAELTRKWKTEDESRAENRKIAEAARQKSENWLTQKIKGLQTAIANIQAMNEALMRVIDDQDVNFAAAKLILDPASTRVVTTFDNEPDLANSPYQDAKFESVRAARIVTEEGITNGTNAIVLARTMAQLKQIHGLLSTEVEMLIQSRDVSERELRMEVLRR